MHSSLFENLSRLGERLELVKEIFGDIHMRIVGGSVRDTLLGVQGHLNDIDMTCAYKPDDIWPSIEQSGFSCYRTKKYGTMTLIVPYPEDSKKRSQAQHAQGSSCNTASDELSNHTHTSTHHSIAYEITPFRTEVDYTDNRHPDTINRSTSLRDDARRRDFTVNSIYYTSLVCKTPISFDETLTDTQIKQTNLSDEKNLLSLLELPSTGGHVLLHDSTPSHPDQSGSIVCISHGKHLLCCVYGILCDELSIINEDILHSFLIKYATNIVWYGEKNNQYTHISLLCDPCYGINDIVTKRIQCVGDPDKRFNEDGLRVIRALRFVNILNQKVHTPLSHDNLDPAVFDLTTPTRLSLRKHYHLVKHVAHERIKDEIMKVFRANNPSGFIALLDAVNLLDYIFPAVAKTKNIPQPVRYHTFDVYAHTLLTLHHIQNINTDRRVKFAMLYHDVGKPEQYYYASLLTTEQERRSLGGSSLNHPISGAKMLEDDARRLGMPTCDIEIMKLYIQHHMAPGMVMGGSGKSIRKKLRAWISNRGETVVHNLLDITIADRLGQLNPIQKPRIDGIQEMHRIVDDLITQEGRFTMSDMAVNGTILMEYLSLSPGPRIGDLLHKAFARVLEDHATRNTKEKILSFLQNDLQ